MVVDSFRGSHDANENDSRIVRPLRGLAAVAEETNAAILIIHHVKKLNPDEPLKANSARGSNAFLATVRCQLAVDRPTHGSDWRRIQVLGENLGTHPSPLGFIITDGCIEVGSVPSAPTKGTIKGECKIWLESYMTPGHWYDSSHLESEARKAGHSASAMQRAKEELGIVRPRHVKKVAGTWMCSRPT